MAVDAPLPRPLTAEDLRLIKAPDVAKMLGLSVPRVRQLAQEGKLASIKMDRAVRFDPKDVAEFIKSHRRERR